MRNNWCSLCCPHPDRHNRIDDCAHMKYTLGHRPYFWRVPWYSGRLCDICVYFYKSAKYPFFLRILGVLYEVWQNALCGDHIYPPLWPNIINEPVLWIFMKFGMGVFHTTLLGNYASCGNRRGEIRLFEDINVFLATISRFLCRFGWNWA